MKIGFALCGSFCTFHQVFPVMEKLAAQHEITPIFSDAAWSTDTRFGTASHWQEEAVRICDREPIRTIAQAEPIGPKKLLDALIIAPCTGNTLAKLAHSIADSPVTMAAKSHLRNGRPLVIALATNDALSANFPNLASLLCRKNVYFVPMAQDDPVGKPTSVIAAFELIPEALKAAAEGKQIMPVYLPVKG